MCISKIVGYVSIQRRGHALEASIFKVPAPHCCSSVFDSAVVSISPSTSGTVKLDRTCLSSPETHRLKYGVECWDLKSAAVAPGWETIIYISDGHFFNSKLSVVLKDAAVAIWGEEASIL